MGAFKVYVHVCLRADRFSGRLNLDHGDLATALRKSRRPIVKYVEQLRKHGVCTTREAVSQHADGEIEICDALWPCVKSGRAKEGSERAAATCASLKLMPCFCLTVRLFDLIYTLISSDCLLTEARSLAQTCPLDGKSPQAQFRFSNVSGRRPDENQLNRLEPSPESQNPKLLK